MKRREQVEQDAITNINVVPLVDIFLVLLIIFMITANFFVEESMKLGKIPVDLPRAASGKNFDKTVKMSIVVFQNGSIKLNGKSAQLSDLRDFIKKAAKNKKKFQSVISADRKTEFQKVVKVMDFLQQNGADRFAINVEIIDLEKE